MELLKSKKFKLPILYFIDNREDIKKLPIGVPFIYSDRKNRYRIIRMLEYEVIWRRAIASGFPFNFRQLLREAGFAKVNYQDFNTSTYIDVKTDTSYDPESIDTSEKALYQEGDDSVFDELIEDCSAYVDINVLKNLNVFPTWLVNIETAIETNIHNFAVYNPYMYNKKLEGMYGSIDLQSPNKNLIVIDISGSIPRAVGTTCLMLARHLVESFYADLMITGSETFLFPYEELGSLNIEGLYDSIGRGNETEMYRALVCGEPKKYSTAIVFGDNDTPCGAWEWNVPRISREDAQKACTWTVDKMISLHTTSNTIRAAYGDFFAPKEVQYVKDWVKYIKK